MNDSMSLILFVAYAAAGYWAAKQTIYANKIMVSNKFGAIFTQILIMGMLLGWALIPIALIKKFLGSR